MHSIVAKIKHSGLIFTALLFMGVKCDRPESVGPDYLLAPEGFTVNSFSPASTSVNFTPAGTTLGFNASFSDSVYWTLKIKGLSSGAVKEIRGISSGINTINPDWLWDGSHDGQYFFMKNEQVEVTLVPLGSNLVQRDTLTITGTKTFKNVLIGDFETGTPLSGQFPTWVAGPSGAFAENPADPGSGGAYLDTSMADPNNPNLKFKPIQGIRAYSIFGRDGNSSYFVCGIRRGALPVSTFPANPDSVYLNVYIYGTGDPNSKLNFGAQEDDGDNDGPGLGNGVHHTTSDDEFTVQVSLDHVGWKLFSFKYSSLARNADPANGGNGNNIHQPKEITGIPFALISSPPGNDVRVIFDFPIITFGAPFDPSK